jgi:divalent metal cation (Fe/Co/Zn/Cd) transporter
MEVHNIAVLADGTRREVTMHARVAEEETLGGVADTLSRLRAEIAHDLSAGDVHIHLEPFAPEAQEAREVTQIESELAERATQAAEQAAGAPCLVELWRQDRRLVAVCALEADPSLSVRAAHLLAGDVEDAVREAAPILADVIVEVSPRTSART